MMPTQYRALEALRDAAGTVYGGLLVARSMDVPPGRVHPRTADALERRGLARRAHVLPSGDEILRITDDGHALLAARPHPMTP